MSTAACDTDTTTEKRGAIESLESLSASVAAYVDENPEKGPAVRASMDYHLGIVEQNAGDHEAANRLFRQVSECDLPTEDSSRYIWALAKLALAQNFYDGLGVEKDEKRCFELTVEAAAHGQEPIAQYRLGVFYANAVGVERDLGLAADWTLKAASAGHELAQLQMIRICGQGLGVVADADKAKEWAGKAGRTAQAPAKLLLAEFVGED